MALVSTRDELNLRTGVAVMNLEESSTRLEFELASSNGLSLSTAVTDDESDLPPLGHRAFFVDEIDWQEPAELKDFVGLLRVKASGKIAAMVLQTRPGQLATMPVTGR